MRYLKRSAASFFVAALLFWGFPEQFRPLLELAVDSLVTASEASQSIDDLAKVGVSYAPGRSFECPQSCYCTRNVTCQCGSNRIVT